MENTIMYPKTFCRQYNIKPTERVDESKYRCRKKSKKILNDSSKNTFRKTVFSIKIMENTNVIHE